MQLGIELLQRKDGVTILYDQDDQVRHVRLNAAHPAKVTPSPMGDFVGHYEGDTLVVDTIGIKPGPYAMVDRYGSPVTEVAACRRTLSADRRSGCQGGTGALRKIRRTAQCRAAASRSRPDEKRVAGLRHRGGSEGLHDTLVGLCHLSPLCI